MPQTTVPEMQGGRRYLHSRHVYNFLSTYVIVNNMADARMFIMHCTALEFIQTIFDLCLDFSPTAGVFNFCAVSVKLCAESIICELSDRYQVSCHPRCVQHILEQAASLLTIYNSVHIDASDSFGEDRAIVGHPDAYRRSKLIVCRHHTTIICDMSRCS